MPSRTAQTWCMESCKTDKGCRNTYRCARAEEIDENGAFVDAEYDDEGGLISGGVPEEDQIARVLDLSNKSLTRGFCVTR